MTEIENTKEQGSEEEEEERLKDKNKRKIEDKREEGLKDKKEKGLEEEEKGLEEEEGLKDKKEEELEEEEEGLEEEGLKDNKFTVLNSIKENYLSWAVIFIAIYLISPHQYVKALITFFFIFFLVYYSHTNSHKSVNILTILHKYHHDHSNFFSHFIQYIIELGYPAIFLPIYYLFGTPILDEWIIMFSALFYSTIHNINYGYLRVNNVHFLHHTHPTTNIGPDLCDIIFGTKNPLNETVENTNHYIPNVIVITICILFLKKLCLTNEWFKNIFSKIVIYFLISSFLFYIGASVYVLYSI